MELNCVFQWGGSGCAQKSRLRSPPQRCSVSALTPGPDTSFCGETCSAKSRPGQYLLKAVPTGHFTFAVDGGKLCFTVSNIYLFDLSLHILNENVKHFCRLL